MVELICCPSTQVDNYHHLKLDARILTDLHQGLVAKKTRAVYLTCYSGNFGIEDGLIVQTLADYHCVTSFRIGVYLVLVLRTQNGDKILLTSTPLDTDSC